MENHSAEETNISVIRTVISWVFGILWTALCAILALLSFALTRDGRIVHRVSWLWSRVLLWIAGFKVELHGIEYVPQDHSILLIANHQSLADILVLSGYLPIRFAWIAKKELFRIPLLGSAMKAAGYIPIDRKNRENAFNSIEEAGNQLKTLPILIFPEGTRTRTGKLGKFKSGAIHLASASGVPLLPITITNSFERIPPDKRGISPGTIHVTIDPEICTEGLTRESLNQIMNEIHDQMEARIAQS
jgi:1-acyl-sn-glycerol-3-phosphate acyltransferase